MHASCAFEQRLEFVFAVVSDPRSLEIVTERHIDVSADSVEVRFDSDGRVLDDGRIETVPRGRDPRADARR